MDTAMQILVIIVSATLTLFLILAIAVLIAVLKLVKTLRRISDKAEALADKAEVVGDFFSKAAGPAAVGRLITHLADNVLSRGKKSRKGSDDE